MKILVFYLENASQTHFFSDENLVTLRHLMSVGSFGLLGEREPNKFGWISLARKQGDADLSFDSVLTLWEYFVEAGQRCWFVGELPKALVGRIESQAAAGTDKSGETAEIADTLSTLQQEVASPDWEFGIYFSPPGGFASQAVEAYQAFDSMLGETLGALSSEVVILIVVHLTEGDMPGAFILASPNNPLVGEIEGGEMYDISPTVLELAGFPLPEGIIGRSLVNGMLLNNAAESGLTDEEEAILRERLSGLGYI